MSSLPLLPLLLLLLPLIAAHQSYSDPIPISRDVACRISRSENCPGPCPTRHLRKDQTPNNPSITAQRGSFISISTLANNHRGGFSRWTLVHVRDIYNRAAHTRNTFLFTCADTNIARCTKKERRKHCNYDLQNVYYRHKIQIPKIYPDGVYVLGWVWFGGGERWGQFGDYYDCMYIKVNGGPMSRSHRPQFIPGNSVSGRNGFCRATVNNVGICTREPCEGGGRYTTLQKPAPFVRGIPSLLRRESFNNPFRIKPRNRNSPFVKSLSIRLADRPNVVLASSLRNKFFHIRLSLRMRSTVTCETTGRVKSVTFYINGREGRTDSQAPYTIGGDHRKGRTRRIIYSPWMFDVAGKYVTLACMAKGFDGTFHYRNVELSTTF